jgi:hypothetical protein
MTPMIGIWELVITLMLTGTAGVPVGVPPMQEDPLLAKVAPAECLYYSTWAGAAEPDPESTNRTERLLAEPELKHFLKEVESTIKTSLYRAAEGESDPRAALAAEAGPKLVRLLLTRPTAYFVSEVEPRERGVDVRGGLVVNCGDKGEETLALLRRIQRIIPSEALAERTTVEIEGVTFQRLRPRDPGAPVIEWGLRGEHLIVGLGEGSAAGIVERAATDPPAWLTAAREKVTVPRVSSFAYADIKAIRELAMPLVSDTPTWAYLAAAGVTNVDGYYAVTGLDDEEFVSRTLLAIDGDARGIFQLADAQPLSTEDLQVIPKGAAVAVALRLDPHQVLETVLGVVREADAGSADRMEAAVVGTAGMMGFDLREDLLKAIGDTWYIYSDPDAGGYLTGWTAVAGVRNRMSLEATHSKLLRMARASFADERRAPQIKEVDYRGHTIYFLSVPDDDMPLAPAWCLTDKYVVAGLYPQNVKAFLSRKEDYQPLTESPQLAKALQEEPNPLLVSYVDLPQLFEPAYAAAQVFARAMLGEMQEEGIDLDISVLPSAGSIKKHLRASVTTVRRTEEGIELVGRQSLPGGNLGTAAPVAVALILPAVQSARSAARRAASMNNLKQIGLALHNYHDVHGHFPAAYSTDDEGKPLLSWRVHVLPYLEQRELYDRFNLDEPWDSEHNRELIKQMPAAFRAPTSTAEAGKTNYLGNFGEHAVFAPPAEGERGKELPEGIGMASIVDGTSNTILAVEANDERAAVWTKPADFTPGMRSPIEGLTGVRPGGFVVLMCDGSVRFISESVAHDTMRSLLTRDDGRAIRLP